MEVVGQPIPFSGDFLQLLLWFSRAFPGQLLGIIPPVCPGSARGLFTVGRSWDIPKGWLYVELLTDQREILILSPWVAQAFLLKNLVFGHLRQPLLPRDCDPKRWGHGIKNQMVNWVYNWHWCHLIIHLPIRVSATHGQLCYTQVAATRWQRMRCDTPPPHTHSLCTAPWVHTDTGNQPSLHACIGGSNPSGEHRAWSDLSCVLQELRLPSARVPD